MRFLGAEEVERRTSLGRGTIWRLERAGTFPARVKIGPARRVAWIEAEIESWLEEQIASTRGETEPELV
ncbi:hypothetical protein BH18GEM1_BH18GEM1_08220 [soil metagenome]